MLVGELARRTGCSKDTIRFYEKKGLIRIGPSERRKNNYKEYSREVLERLLVIKEITQYGFTLRETADVLELIDHNRASCARGRDRMVAKIEAIDQKIAELQRTRALLSEASRRYARSPGGEPGDHRSGCSPPSRVSFVGRCKPTQTPSQPARNSRRWLGRTG